MGIARQHILLLACLMCCLHGCMFPHVLMWSLQFGQLGLAKHEDAPLPEPVMGLAGQHIVQLACGWRHSLAVSSAGNVFAWGRAGNGQLGLGDGRIPDQ